MFDIFPLTTNLLVEPNYPERKERKTEMGLVLPEMTGAPQPQTAVVARKGPGVTLDVEEGDEVWLNFPAVIFLEGETWRGVVEQSHIYAVVKRAA